MVATDLHEVARLEGADHLVEEVEDVCRALVAELLGNSMGWCRDDFMVAGSSAGEPGAARAGGLPRGREHREVQLLVELDELALRGGGEQFAAMVVSAR